MTTGVSAVAWVFVMQPYANSTTDSLTTKLISMSNPVGSLLVLAVASRLVLGTRAQTRVFFAVGLGLVLALVGDGVYAAELLNNSYVDGSWVDGTWLSAYVLWAVVALHPSMSRISERTTSLPTRLSLRRLTLLMASTLLAPAMTLLDSVRTNDLQIGVMAGTSAALSVLVIARLLGVVVSYRDAQLRERLLRHAAAKLVTARERPEMYEVAVETAYALAIGTRAGRVAFAIGDLETVSIVAAKGEDAELLIGSTYDVSALVAIGLHERPSELEAFPDELGGLVAFPLLIHGEPRGVITVRAPHVLPKAVRDAIEALGAQVGLALESSALTEALLERQAEERFRSLVQSSTDVIAILEPERRIRYHTPSAEHVLGYGTGDLIGRTIDDLLEEDEVEGFRLACERLAADPAHPVVREIRLIHRNGTVRTFAAVLNNLLDDPNVRGIVLTAHDVTERNALERQLSHQAFHDSLTGLPNRVLFLDRVQHALDRTHRSATTVAVLFIDLDDFKTVNDSLGHAAGDELLVAVGERLHAATRGSDTTARLGGDEFAVLLEDIRSPQQATDAARRVLNAIARPLPLQREQMSVQASIGIALAAHGQTVGELVRNADAAMYDAKSSGKSRFAVFEQRMHTAALRRLEFQAELQRAVDGRSFALHYQPLIELGTGAVGGFEALLRWVHPERGLVLPDEFIPILEDTGLIVPIGALVLETACTDAAAWHRIRPDLQINVNLSGRQLLDGGVLDLVAQTLERTGLPAESLVLEITESVLMTDTEVAIRRLKALKRLGVRLAIDDFGTGYSSLNYLRRFPVDILKIAKPFVDEIGVNAEATQLAEAIIRLGKTLNLTIVAEGIELPEQRDRLRELQCDIGQGFLFARPMPAEEAAWLLELPEARAA